MIFLPCFFLKKKPFFSELPVPFGSFQIRSFQFFSYRCPAHLPDVTLDRFVDESAALPLLGYAVNQLHRLLGKRYIDAAVHGAHSSFRPFCHDPHSRCASSASSSSMKSILRTRDAIRSSSLTKRVCYLSRMYLCRATESTSSMRAAETEH